jgi:hypothetical protein
MDGDTTEEDVMAPSTSTSSRKLTGMGSDDVLVVPAEKLVHLA